MIIYEFDSVVESIGDMFKSSRESVDQHQQSVLKRMFEEDSDGNMKAVTWSISIPTGRNGEGCEEVSLPLLSLRSTKFLNISELSIEFDCKARLLSDREQKKIEQGVDEMSVDLATEEGKVISLDNTEKKKSGLHRLVLWLRKWKKEPRKGLERVKISYKDSDTTEAEITINDNVFSHVDLSDND